MAIFLVLLVGCRSAGSAKLEGRWKGVRVEGVAPDKQQHANVFAMRSEIVAKGNQILLSTPHGQGPQATYVIDREEASTLILHTDHDASKEVFVFHEDKTMSWKFDDRTTIVFKYAGPQ